MDVKLPQYLGYEDVLRLPVRVQNETSAPITAKLMMSLPAGLELDESASKKIEVQARTTETLWFTIRPTGTEGEFPVAIKLESPDHSDEIREVIRVRPVGFPVRLSFSAKELDTTVHIAIRDAEQRSVKAEVTAFPDILSDLFCGAEVSF